jgi:hypothetical protein
MSIGVKGPGQPGTPVIDDDLLALQDGLHAIVQTPDGALVLSRGLAMLSAFGPIFQPDLFEALRRFIQKGRRNDSRSYRVGIEPPAATRKGRVLVSERNESRIEVLIVNNGSAPIYVGGRQVTVGGPDDPSGGVPIAPGTGLVFTNNIGEFWAVAGLDGQDVRVLEVFGD